MKELGLMMGRLILSLILLNLLLLLKFLLFHPRQHRLRQQ